MVRFRLALEVLEERAVPAGLLFFGNSYTDNGNPSITIPNLVHDIAGAAGQVVPNVAERAPGGYTLAQHAAEQSPTSVRSLIPSADVSIFQGQSQETWVSYLGPAYLASFVQGAQNLGDDVRGGFPSAKIVLYETWARPAPDPSPDIYPVPYATPSVLQAEILAGYQQALSALKTRFGKMNADMAPAGEAFKIAGFTPDLYADTGGHPSAKGALLASLAIYGTIYGDNTQDIPYAVAAPMLQPRGLTAADWDRLTRAADAAVGQSDFAENQAWVNQVFLDLLGRPSGTSNPYLDALTAGTITRAQAVQSIQTSDECLNRFINAQYQSLLGRPADSAGLAGFAGQIRAGAGLDVITQQIAASDEFYVKAGNTSSAFVQSLYQKLLGRTPASSETSAWAAQVNAGVSRSAIAWSFINSTEYRTTQVTGLYRTYLRRDPDPAGLTANVGALQRGLRLQDEIAIFVLSTEYLARLV